MIRKLRDLWASLTGYGQCERCGRSWRSTPAVTVWWRPGTGTFLLCVRCWQEVRISANAGLLMLEYADRFLARHPRDPQQAAEIRAAYSRAWRFPLEVEADGQWPPTSLRVRVLGARAILIPPPSQVDAPPAPPTRPSESTPPSVIGWLPSRMPGWPTDPPETYVHVVDREKPWVVSLVHQRCQTNHLPGECPRDAPGWDGAGADVEAQRG